MVKFRKRSFATTEPYVSTKKRRTWQPVERCLYIPDDVIFSHVLPWLPVKVLLRFLLVCRQWMLVIFDPRFMLQQSRRQSSFSSGLIYFNYGGSIAFLPTLGAEVGVPDPKLGIGDSFYIELVASANGLLGLLVQAICCGHRSMVIYNPLTRELHKFPVDKDEGDLWLGLAFDPVSSPEKYTLVRPVWNTTGYFFMTFSSNNCWWTKSTEFVKVGSELNFKKVVFASGVLYWYCNELLMYFDPDKHIAGSLMLPATKEVSYEEEIGVWDDRLTCTRVTSDSVEVWVMVEKKWEMRHFMSMETVLKENQGIVSKYCHRMSVGSRTNWDELRRRRSILPLPYDGGRSIYLRMQGERKEKKKKVKQEVILRCNMETEKIDVLRESDMGKREWRQPFFSFRNIFVALPKLTFETDFQVNVLS